MSNLHSKRRKNFWRKFFSKTIFFQLSWDLEAKCLELPAKSFQQSCQNCFLPVQWTTLRMSIIFSENFESFWTLSDNCPDLWLKFSGAFPNVHSTCPKYLFAFFVNGSHIFLTSDSSEKNISFEKKVSSFLLKLHFKRPENFLRSFYQKRAGFSV